jgi:hypothetical protein
MRKSDAATAKNFQGEYHKHCLAESQSRLQSIKQTRVSLLPPKRISCPVCEMSAGNVSYVLSSNIPDEEDFVCKSCGHPFSFRFKDLTWPYANCFFCGDLLDKVKAFSFDDPNHPTWSYEDPKQVYAHQICYEIPDNTRFVSKADFKRRHDTFWESHRARNGDFVGGSCSVVLMILILLFLTSIFFVIPGLAILGFLSLGGLVHYVVDFLRSNIEPRS